MIRAFGLQGMKKKKLNYLAWVTLTGLMASPGTLAADSTGHLVNLPNVQLWVTDSGGTGEPVILFHPTTANSEIWQQSIPAFVDAGYRVISFDKPGWGKSIVDVQKTPLPVVETLDTLFDLLELEEVHLVSTANGGYFAFDYAIWQPKRVKSLVIAASGLGLDDDPEGDAFRERAEIPGMRQQPSEIREISPLYRGMNPEGVTRWMEIHNNGQQEGAVEPPLLTPNTPQKIATLDVPIFVIAGGIDLVTPSGAIRLWSQHLTVPFEWLLVPEAGHMLVWEQPNVFNQAVIEFLQKH
jgi:pimeloyl-ACP methyl ester carboxylesterase